MAQQPICLFEAVRYTMYCSINRKTAFFLLLFVLAQIYAHIGSTIHVLYPLDSIGCESIDVNHIT